MKNTNNKVMVITGAASGIGRALAIRAAAEKVRLALADRDAAGLSQTAEMCRAAQDLKILQVDVARREEVESAARDIAADFGCVDIVVNNAGVSSSGLIQELTYETLQWTIDINFWGVVHGTKAFLPHLLARPEANLVNVSSVYGLIGVPAQAAYCASKFAAMGFTKSLRKEVDGKNIKVFSVYPGGMQTNLFDEKKPGNYAEFMKPDYVAEKIMKNLKEDTPEEELIIKR